MLTLTKAGNLTGTYTYNAREQLVKRVLTNMTPSGTTHFVHDLMGNVIAETNGVATGTVREYIWLPETQIAPVFAARAQVDRPLAAVDGVNTASPVTWWVHADHLNRPVLMTDGSKAQVWQAVWKPFGEAQSITGPAALDTRFPGQWFQIESGLHYNWHRQYDPTTGRYTQPDPLGFVDGPGAYSYARGNTLAYIDPQGLLILPSDPSGLPPGWTKDPTHKNPKGSRWKHPSGDMLEYHEGQPGKGRHQERGHYHYYEGGKKGDKHLYPGDEIPDPFEDFPNGQSRPWYWPWRLPWFFYVEPPFWYCGSHPEYPECQQASYDSPNMCTNVNL
jgi:RHS repeat-associated protein